MTDWIVGKHMNSLVRNFYKSGDNSGYKDVLFLSERTDVGWTELSKDAPALPRGWFELSRVSAGDRIEFTRDFWLDRLPYLPQAHASFAEFFERLDDVAVVLSKKEEEDPFEAELVYSLEDGSCFFRGRPPCAEEDLAELKNEIGTPLPRDFLAFLKIHNGFGKISEMGLLEAGEIGGAKRRVMEMVLMAREPVKARGVPVDPGALIPFYEALGLSSFQCFYTDWYPGSEMGNVYLSGIDYTISDPSIGGDGPSFAAFSDWLAYYLQGMTLSP